MIAPWDAALGLLHGCVTQGLRLLTPSFPHTTCPCHLPFCALQSETDSSSVGHVVCQKASELRAAAVVMGNHNKGPVKEFFIGSVSQYVMHHCKVPVVIVRNV